MYEGTIWEKIWKVIYPVLIYFMVQIVVRFVAYSIISLTYMGSLEGEGRAAAYNFFDGLSGDLGANAIYVSIISLIITFIIVYKLYDKDKDLRINTDRPKVKLGWVVLCAITLSTGFSRLLSLVMSQGMLNSYDTVEAKLTDGNIVAVIIGAGIMAPVVEEFLFRGLVYTRLKNYTSVTRATLISAIMFGVFHFNLPQGIYACVLGLALAIVYEKYHTIWAPIIFHIAANLFSILLTKTGLSELLSKNMLSYVVIMIVELLIAGFSLYMLNEKNAENVKAFFAKK